MLSLDQPQAEVEADGQGSGKVTEGQRGGGTG